MRAIEAMNRVESGNLAILKNEIWLRHILFTNQERLNVERVNQLSGVHQYVMKYVKRSLEILDEIKSTENLNEKQFNILEEVLKWAEVAKTGMDHQRKRWLEAGYNLATHNIGSAQIYNEICGQRTDAELIGVLIETHGLIGQYIRGELPLRSNFRLREIINNQWCTVEELEILLVNLNQCIIGAVDRSLWDATGEEVTATIHRILWEERPVEYSMIERLRRLRKSAISSGENFDVDLEKIFSEKEITGLLEILFSKMETWYFESALHEFSLEEILKILCLVGVEATNNGQEELNGCFEIMQISFESLMSSLYYDRFGEKNINLYKKRIIESYIKNLSFKNILSRDFTGESIHVQHSFTRENKMVFFNFKFSMAAEKLIEYCQEAEKSDTLYEKAIILLFDLFGLRKDAYDRFYEEERYLQTMNSTIDYKKIILEYIVGDCVLDIGPGGGALMDLIEESKRCKEIIGVDIAQNVLDALSKRKQRENRTWKVQAGDALDLSKVFEPGQVSTVIFCSILHELFSYIPYNNQKFNHDTLAVALKSAYEILPPGGRIIIRDGIMTEPTDQFRIIKFLSKEGLDFLKRYQQDFQGREISVEIIAHNEVKMPVNDAMEFLYTYTWGEESYVHEINEQFGYFTPSQFENFIKTHLGDGAKIVKLEHYLQQGYELYLSQKVEFFDENRTKIQFPDSTCFIVIEK